MIDVLKALFIVAVMFLTASCGNNSSQNVCEDLSADSVFVEESDTVYNNTLPGLPNFLNTVAGHYECDTIVGNFTGKGIDTLYVVAEEKENPEWEGEAMDYWAVCSNPAVPRQRLWGHTLFQPKLVYEGDLDRNGKDEWGYLHTWMNSQWRTYRVFTLVGKEWRYLSDEWEALNTSEFLRGSGKEIVEPGPRKGTIKINYTEWNYGREEIKEIIIVPNFAVIDDDG